MRLPPALRAVALLFAASSALMVTAPVMAQVQSVDPNTVIDADLNRPPAPPAPSVSTTTPDSGTGNTSGAWSTDGLATDPSASAPPTDPTASAADGTAATTPTATVAPGTTFQRDDLIGAAEGVFGRGAEGLARIIENILREQGEPTAYIVGREASGAFILGLRYGSGTLHHRVEGQMPAYWTGPSIGFDAGANGGSTFILVYNLQASDDLFHRFPAGEGAAYLIGGFNASYMRRGNVVLIPIRLGVGARLGVNVGYMKFSHRQNWLPF
jgi:hypothetical protein